MTHYIGTRNTQIDINILVYTGNGHIGQITGKIHSAIVQSLYHHFFMSLDIPITIALLYQSYPALNSQDLRRYPAWSMQL